MAEERNRRAGGFINVSDGKSNSLEIAFCSYSSRLWKRSASPTNRPINAYFHRVRGASTDVAAPHGMDD